MTRRIAAVVLPRLASELAAVQTLARDEGKPTGRALAVVLSEQSEEAANGAALVGAVDDAAAALGVRPGMRVSEAMARSAAISFINLSPHDVEAALAAFAEVAMMFGPVVEVDAASLDTIWIDVTGVAHLFGGEAVLREEIETRVAALRLSNDGFPSRHRVEVAIADGPFYAQALARFVSKHPDLPRIAAPGEGKRAMRNLPVAALGLSSDCVAFFGRLGVLTISDLDRIDRAQLTSRLESFSVPSASGATRNIHEVLGWLDGRDARPLVPFQPSEVLVDRATFEDGVEMAPRLVFAVRGLVSRLSARLMGRRQATNRIEVVLAYDRSIFALRGGTGEASSRLGFDLPAPLSHVDDLFRAVKAKVEGLELPAPVIRLEIHLSRIVRAPEVQLDLSRDVSVSPDALPALLSELSAEIGAERVGVLACADDHRPERRSALVGIHEAAARRPRRRSEGKQTSLFEEEAFHSEPAEPSRILPEPVLLTSAIEGGRRVPPFQPGQCLFIGKQAVVVDEIRFDRRLESVAWWTSKPSSRDYLRVRVRFGASEGTSKTSTADAWIYVERRTGSVFLHGWWE
ncbi:MAG: hypothetical protein HOW73_23685 [Polyangiaceae bacterium]|nr:hypothetical protein [Polyangiaceae bacterium]